MGVVPALVSFATVTRAGRRHITP